MPCLQATLWSRQLFPDVVKHIGEFENEQEWILNDDAAKSLRHFFLDGNFDPFLIALDTDETRVAARAKHAEEKEQLKEKMRMNGVLELWRWHEDGKDFNEDDYDTTAFPKIPIPYDSVIALEDLMKDVSMEETTIYLLTSCMLNMSRYIHGLHYKIDDLQSKCRQVAGAPAHNITQAALLLKHPWLSRCDDHVLSLPPGEKAIDLARTPPVIACVLAFDQIVCVLILS